MKLKLLFVLLLLGCAAGPATAAALKFVNITPGIDAPTDNLLAVTHDGDATLVAVGENGRFFRGRFVPNQIFTNSIPWTRTNSSSGTRLAAVASSGSLFVASGNNNQVLVSSDGVSWTNKHHIFDNTAVTRGLAYADGKFVAVETAPAISHTELLPPANSVWNSAKLEDPVSYAESYRAVTPIANGFAACGFFGVVRRSVDQGLNWAVVKDGVVGGPDLFGIAWDGASTLVSVGKKFNETNGIIIVSTANGDNGTWTDKITIDNQPFGELDAITHTGSEFLAVGKNGLVLTSPNGLDWTSHSTDEVGTTRDLNGVTFSTTGSLRGVGALVGARGTVILAGTNPPAPVNLGNRSVCAGGEQELAVSVTNGVGIDLVTVDWFSLPFGGSPVANGTFTYTPPLQINNVSQTNHFWAEARDLRTGFTSTNRTLVILTNIARPTALVTNHPVLCNGETAELHAILTGVPPWRVLWSDGSTTNYTLDNVLQVASNTIPGIAWTNYIVDAAHVFAPPTNAFLNQPTNYSSYRVNEVSDNFCTARSEDITNRAVITVNPRPTATVSGTTTICNGDSTTVQAVLTGIGPWTVVWSSNGLPIVTNIVEKAPPNGPTNTTLLVTPANPHLNSATNVIYTVTALLDANCMANPGDLTGSAIITVNPRPRAALWSFNTTDCNGTIAYTLTNTLTGLGPWTVRWNDGTVQSHNATAGPVVLTRTVYPTNTEPNQLTNNIYFVTSVSNANTCIGNEPGDITGAVTNTVNPRPTATLWSFNTTDCNRTIAYTLTNTLTGLGPWTVRWNDGTVQSNNAAAGPVFLTRTVYPTNTEPNQLTNNIYFVMSVSNANTCIGNQPGDITGAVTNTVNPRPTSRLTSLDRTNCNDGSAYEIQAALTGIGPWAVTWWDGAISNAMASPATRTVYPTNALANATTTSSYWVNALSDTNCTANQPGDIHGTNRVTVNPRPTAVVSGATNICNGTTATVQAALTGIGPWSVTWSSNGTVVATHLNVTSTPDTLVVMPFHLNAPTNVTYTVTALSDTNCLATAGDITGNAVIMVYPVPVAPPVSLGDQTTCSNVVATLSVSVPPGFTADWYDSTGTTLLLAKSTNYVPPLQTLGSNRSVTNTYRVAARFDTNIVSCQFATMTNVSLITEICPAVLTIKSMGGTNALLEWHGNYYLQRTPSLSVIPATWTNLIQGTGGTSNVWTNSMMPPPTNSFFRLFGPTN